MTRHPTTEQMLRYFDHRHLTAPRLQRVSAKFQRLARELVEILPDGPELTVALRKLLESKDAAVRHAVFTPEENPDV